jgi:hypothetical protein
MSSTPRAASARPHRRTVAICLSMLLALCACGGDDEGAAGAGASAGTGASASGGAGSGASGGSSSGSGGSGGSAVPAACGDLPAPDADIQQKLPEVFLDTTYGAPTGATIAVPAGGDVQAALDAAQPGDTITLEAGATYAGTLRLPNKSGDGWITLRTSTSDADFIPPGQRATPADAAAMAKIVAPAALPAIVTEPGAHHYRLIGLELAPIDKVDVYVLLQLGDPSDADPGNVPHDIVIDRLYVHGYPDHYLKRCIGLDSARSAVIDSWVSDCHAQGQDAQAIAGFNGPGPFKIVNNYLEGSGENVIFGGATPAIDGLIPSDIEIAQNHLYKPLHWKADDPSYAGIDWSIKNVFELKNAQRVLFRCNVLENNWADSQVGFAVLFTPRGEDGAAPWAVVQDITFVKNLIRGTASGINVLGKDDGGPSGITSRILIQDNLLLDVDGDAWGGGSGWLYQMLSGAQDIKIDHNTGMQSSSLVVADGDANAGFVFTNNLSPHNDYGVFGSGSSPGNASLSQYFPGATFLKNVIPGADAGSYPADNFYPATMAEVGFVDAAAGDYRLDPASPYAAAGSDGRDCGADLVALEKGIAGVAGR